MNTLIERGLKMSVRNYYYNVGLAALVLICGYVWQVSKSSENTGTVDAKFVKFRNNYLFVYSLVMISDWLQGPYIYALYKSYGYDLNQIGVLFVVGFLSSAVFGTIAGSISDRFGRKLGSVAFCVIYFASCVTKFFPDYQVLLFGRLLGGVSTSLLFSVFESWMVSEHTSRGFESSLLTDTFAWSTFLNGLVAILAGVASNITVDHFGLVSPFAMSACFLVISAGVVQASWCENYGEKNQKNASKSMWEVMAVVKNDINIFATGTIQYCFESAMYTFVFLWSPVLETSAGANVLLPFGVMFSSFMVCIMIGSMIFKVLVANNMSHERIASFTFLIACGAFIVPAITQNEIMVYLAFNVFELCCGVYFPTIGSIRSKVIPEETRSTIMSLFRVPLNLIVVVILLRVDSIPRPFIFSLCSLLMLVSCYYARRMAKRSLYEPAVSLDTDDKIDRIA